jgi:predicted small secreted protein
MTARRAAVLPILVLTATVLVGCGGGDDDSTAGATSTEPSSSAPATTSGSATGGNGGTDGDTGGDGSTDAPPFPANTEPDTGQASSDSFVTVTDVRTGRHDGFDRVVFEVDGTGTPGWDVRYVDAATAQGSGADIPVEGDAILQVTITGIGLPTETGIDEYDGSQPLPGNGTEMVTEVVWDSTFEGTSVAFVGMTDELPFRVYLLEDPARVVLEVRHDG